jgi:predicted RNA binding protein YcfA (HicA-like mRNA interferase family)
MSPKLPAISGANAVRVLEKAGFKNISQRGSHVKMRNEDGRTAIVPMHRELAPGTLRSILRQSGITIDWLLELLRR